MIKIVVSWYKGGMKMNIDDDSEEYEDEDEDEDLDDVADELED